MKRLVSVFLVCVLALATLSGATAELFYMEGEGDGIIIDVPEGMTAEDMSVEGTAMLVIKSESDPNIGFFYALQYIDELADKFIEDLTEEESTMLLEGLAAYITDPIFDSVETEDLNLLLITSGDGMQVHYVFLLSGLMCDVAVIRADGVLTQEDLDTAVAILYSLQFSEDYNPTAQGE